MIKKMKVQLIRNIMGGFDVLRASDDKILGMGEFNGDEYYLKDLVKKKDDLKFKKPSEIVDYYFSIEELDE